MTARRDSTAVLIASKTSGVCPPEPARPYRAGPIRRPAGQRPRQIAQKAQSSGPASPRRSRPAFAAPRPRTLDGAPQAQRRSTQAARGRRRAGGLPGEPKRDASESGGRGRDAIRRRRRQARRLAPPGPDNATLRIIRSATLRTMALRSPT